MPVVKGGQQPELARPRRVGHPDRRLGGQQLGRGPGGKLGVARFRVRAVGAKSFLTPSLSRLPMAVPTLVPLKAKVTELGSATVAAPVSATGWPRVRAWLAAGWRRRQARVLQALLQCTWPLRAV